MFTDDERAIFEFNNGFADVKADPRAILRVATMHGVQKAHHDFAKSYAAWQQATPKLPDLPEGDPILEAVKPLVDEAAGQAAMFAAMQAEELMVRGIRAALGMAEIDPETGEGATDKMCLSVWRLFNEFTEKKKMKPAT